MTANNKGFHEADKKLSTFTKELHRALVSLQEELEAADWYQQRANATEDDALRRILEHHRDEEKEHAAMLIEWIRRADPSFDEKLRTYLFTEADLIEVEEEAEHKDANPGTTSIEQEPAAPPTPRLTVGSLLK
jgi:ferritin-like protein